MATLQKLGENMGNMGNSPQLPLDPKAVDF
jgi:hypothetical protein